jgi:hypothetical protein
MAPAKPSGVCNALEQLCVCPEQLGQQALGRTSLTLAKVQNAALQSVLRG